MPEYYNEDCKNCILTNDSTYSRCAEGFHIDFCSVECSDFKPKEKYDWQGKID